MKIEVRELMDDNEMLSHIFLGCMSIEEIEKVRDKYVAGKDWQKESVKIPVEMKIGGIAVNPKDFFNQWKVQMQGIINKEAIKLVVENTGSSKVRELQDRLNNIESLLEDFEKEINWQSPNPFTT